MVTQPVLLSHGVVGNTFGGEGFKSGLAAPADQFAGADEFFIMMGACWNQF